ncbi:phosphatase PAP2 family protein [Rhizobium lusitanum]|uniref:Membrane-associated phospholipid phosphatase n=1 Tax=Rhizobium lusitanum TaxID=293958 RepID=A0A7X0MDR0_9HYPH|nr:phosphatase PAP2 family protein [Rhizobium lusitanum]MBB6486696.1 membrane-associated phospholipid phosphatase [Rhizobium lusitanum]
MLDVSKPRLLLLAGTPVSYFAIWILAKISGLQLELKATLGSIFAIALTICAVSIFATKRKMLTLRAVVECMGCGLLLILPNVIATYLAMRANFPLADAQLSRLDSWLGVDWRSAMIWLDKNGLLAEILNQAYRTFSYQLLLFPLILIVAKRSARAYQMIIAYALICFIASGISTLWPAVGTYVFYNFDPTTLQNIDPTYGYEFLAQFQTVREDPNFVWSLEKSSGILTFPSVHAATATLCAWAMWDLRLFRYPALALNIAMALSAVPSANHYVVDVLAGCLVGLCAIAAVVWLTKTSKVPALADINSSSLPSYP